MAEKDNTMKKKNNKVLYILIAVVVAAGIGAAIAKRKGMIGGKEKTEVTIAKVKRSNIIEKVSASGKIQPEIEVKISPDVSGEIIEMQVKEGDSIQKGQFLLRIKPDNYRSLLDRARATLNSTKASATQSLATLAQAEARLQRSDLEYNRNMKLHDQKVIADADWEQIKANHDVAVQDVEAAKQAVEAANFSVQSSEAALKDASETLHKTEIYSPVSGIISKLSVEKGERVVGTAQMTGTEIMRIANLNNMEVLVDVNENDIVRVQLNDSAEIDVDSYSSTGRKFKGLVTAIANTAKTSTAADAVTEFEVKVRILPESYQDLLVKTKGASPFRPGMTASVDIITDRKFNVLTVPLAAVTMRLLSEDKANNPDKDQQEDDNKPKVTSDVEKMGKKEEPKEVVFVFKDGKANRQPVKTGISDFDNIEILEGLKENEEIVSGPFLLVSKKLKDKEEVQLKKEQDKKDKADSKND